MPEHIPEGTERRASDRYCMSVLITALFTTLERWGQPKCPGTEAQTHELWHMHTAEYYSVVRRTGVFEHE